MTLLTPNPVSRNQEEGGEPLCQFAVLDSEIYQGPRWCVNCGGEKVFVEQFEFEGGRFGVCLGCGEERIERFSRTNSEVA